MTVFNGDGKTAQSVTNSVQVRLGALRRALGDIEDLYAWTSGVSPADLATATGLSQSDAQSIFDAVADAHWVAVMYGGGTYTGQLPHNFSASQAAVLGPS